MLKISKDLYAALAEDRLRHRIQHVALKAMPDICVRYTQAELQVLVEASVLYGRKAGAASERELAACAFLGLLTGGACWSSEIILAYLASHEARDKKFSMLLERMAFVARPNEMMG